MSPVYRNRPPLDSSPVALDSQGEDPDSKTVVSSMFEEGTNPPPLTGREVCIVGSRRLQNELVAYVLERETGARCETRAEIHHVSVRDDTNNGSQRQILWDCSGKDPETILSEIESRAKTLIARDLVVLFNVQAGLGIEEKTVALGVRGVFYENDPLHLFLKGVQAVFLGELWLSRKIMTRCILNGGQKTLPGENGTALTHRETEILAMIAVGSTNEEVADKLCISPHTVKTHIYNIFKKINVPNRLQAALWAAQNL